MKLKEEICLKTKFRIIKKTHHEMNAYEKKSGRLQCAEKF